MTLVGQRCPQRAKSRWKIFRTLPRRIGAVKTPAPYPFWAVFSIISFLSSFCASGEPPPLDGFYPAGGERGTTNTVTAIGKFSAWAPRVWISETGLAFSAETNKGKFSVVIAADAIPGPRLVRLYNDDGTSDPHIFIVGAGRESTESEPNNHFAKPQPIPELPVTINGRLDKNGDVDSFALDLLAGQWLDARIDGYTLMSKVDAILKIVTTNGQQLAWNHDFVTLDPRLLWKAPADQRVVVQVFGFAYPPGSDIGLTGGEAVAYRLHLTLTNQVAAPCEVTPAVQSQEKGSGELLDLPALITGNIPASAVEHRFKFAAQKNESIEATVEAASLGSPLDAWLKVQDEAGNQLARNDDADGSPDPRLEWKAPTNGTYVLVLGSVTHRGGKEFCYRLDVKKVAPDFRATLAANSLALATGTTNELRLDFKRLRGFTNELVVTVRGLPPGVTFISTNLPAKDGAVSLRLTAEEGASPSQGPIRIVIVDSQTKDERTISFELITRGETGFAHLLVETSEDFWLTVRHKPAEEKKPDQKK